MRDLIKCRVSLLILAIFGLYYMGCKSVPFQPSQHDGDLLTIGTGGGFAGIETRFHILPNGSVHKQIGQDTVLIEQDKLSKKIVEQAFENCKVFALQDYEYAEPDNAYKFMVVKLNGKTNRIVWSGDDEKIKPLCKNIYQSLNKLIHDE